MRVSAAEGIDAARAVQTGRLRRPHRAEGHAVARAGEDAGREEPVRRMLRPLLQARRLRAGRRRRETAIRRNPTGAGRLRQRGHGRQRRRIAVADAAGRRPRGAGDRDGSRPRAKSGIQNIRFFTQKNLYARRILDRMGLRQVERDIEALRKDDRHAPPTGWRTASKHCATRRATWSNATCCCSPAARRKSSARNC